MTGIDRVASSQKIDWRTLARLMPSAAPTVAGALYTKKRFRTDQQKELIAAAQRISEDDTARERREKCARRQRGVNDLGVGRVHGRTLEGGQPRGQARRKKRS